jgi:hypothetical protein
MQRSSQCQTVFQQWHYASSLADASKLLQIVARQWTPAAVVVWAGVGAATEGEGTSKLGGEEAVAVLSVTAGCLHACPERLWSRAASS